MKVGQYSHSHWPSRVQLHPWRQHCCIQELFASNLNLHEHIFSYDLNNSQSGTCHEIFSCTFDSLTESILDGPFATSTKICNIHRWPLDKFVCFIIEMILPHVCPINRRPNLSF